MMMSDGRIWAQDVIRYLHSINERAAEDLERRGIAFLTPMASAYPCPHCRSPMREAFIDKEGWVVYECDVGREAHQATLHVKE